MVTAEVMPRTASPRAWSSGWAPVMLDRASRSLSRTCGASWSPTRRVGSRLVMKLVRVSKIRSLMPVQERRSNRLRDYTTMAGPLGVSHLLLFSKSPSGNTNLRLAITPRGPTLTFRVERYSLCKDVMKSQRHPKPMGGGVEHLTPPLVSAPVGT